MFTGELCSWTHFSLADILVLAGTARASRIAPPASTRISARLKRVHEHSSPVSMWVAAARCSATHRTLPFDLRLFFDFDLFFSFFSPFPTCNGEPAVAPRFDAPRHLRTPPPSAPHLSQNIEMFSGTDGPFSQRMAQRNEWPQRRSFRDEFMRELCTFQPRRYPAPAEWHRQPVPGSLLG